MGKEEVKTVTSGRKTSAQKYTEDESESTAGLYLYVEYGWGAGGKDQEIILRSLLRTAS